MSDVNVLERVEAGMASDTERSDKQSELLVEAYHRATPEAQAVVDEIFICLCGWSLDSILAGRDDNGDDDGDEA
jgi:hypothetical protein